MAETPAKGDVAAPALRSPPGTGNTRTPARARHQAVSPRRHPQAPDMALEAIGAVPV
jgi:hypothetical protein